MHYLWVSKSIFLLILVVQPSYEIDVFKENAILGNDAIFKCQIPSFVSDLVTVESWVDSESKEIRMNSDLGKAMTNDLFYFAFATKNLIKGATWLIITKGKCAK